MWQFFIIASIVFLLCEAFISSLFFINFAIAALICAAISVFVTKFSTLIYIFCGFSALLVLILRPVLLKMQNKSKQKTGMEEKYVGKIVKVVEDINSTQGVVSIYDERWQARTDNNECIVKGEQAVIVGYDSIIFKVKKLENKE